MACFFLELVESDKDYLTGELLIQANRIAVNLWDYAKQEKCPEYPGVWLEAAINHPAGDLANFWLHSISIWRKECSRTPEALNQEYRSALCQIVQDETKAGMLGRSVLARGFSFMALRPLVWVNQSVEGVPAG